MISYSKMLICTPTEIAKTIGMSPSNLHNTYIASKVNPKSNKQNMLKAIDIGTYCLIHNVTPDELKLLVSLSVEIKTRMVEKVKGITL